MTSQEKEAVATLCLMAAFADGQKGDAERQHIKAVVESLEGVSAPALYQKVLLNQVTLEEAAEALERPETRHLAFEMAAGVCDADGVTNAAEQAFYRGSALPWGCPKESASRSNRQPIILPPSRSKPTCATRRLQPRASLTPPQQTKRQWAR